MIDTRATLDIPATLAEIAQAAAERTLPPVESWHPERTGDSEMRIAREGTWFHQDAPIPRPEMVRLFSTILRREPDGAHVLVTPAEKLTILVEDAAFIAVAVASEGEGEARRLGFTLNTGDPVIAGPGHAIFLRDEAPYLHVRAGLEARIARPVYYELADIAIAEGRDPAGVWSEGAYFPLIDA
ncbi:DUF1285 domain-containing protein [Sphingosinicella soli]|uniref:DUF1285 domain-containing protein n=1 Tax=Sphingosinicella soli TaxID=333708 RepID=A0A7W7B1B4_9SPHN|nr:DUF1285 domain-containing protein [Sphingosinicella soli]MBB4631155.1 hypothetical protein [Sphingosinicella soli]